MSSKLASCGLVWSQAAPAEADRRLRDRTALLVPGAFGRMEDHDVSNGWNGFDTFDQNMCAQAHSPELVRCSRSSSSIRGAGNDRSQTSSSSGAIASSDAGRRFSSPAERKSQLCCSRLPPASNRAVPTATDRALDCREARGTEVGGAAELPRTGVLNVLSLTLRPPEAPVRAQIFRQAVTGKIPNTRRRRR